MRATTSSQSSDGDRPTYPRGLSATSRGRVLPPAERRGAGRVPLKPDFRKIDFERLWEGRERVTEVESMVLREALALGEPDRVLEIGCGTGRLSRAIQHGVHEYVGLDATPEFLEKVSLVGEGGRWRLAADLHHLPFADESFTAATLVRVFAFLPDPAHALREIARVLRPGGILVLSFEPHPSLGSLVDDLKMAFRPEGIGSFRPRTFHATPTMPVQPSTFPAWSSTRARLGQLLGVAELTLEREFPTGLEDFRPLRPLPARVFLGLAHALSHMGGFPSRFIVARRGPRTSRAPAP